MSSLGLHATGAALAAIDRYVPDLVTERFASRLGAQDSTLWGPDAEAEAGQRLGWIDLFDGSRQLIEPILNLHQELKQDGVRRVVLAGMGGSSLAPEVIVGNSEFSIVVLDSTDPEMIGNILAAGVNDTILIVSSKSGSTVETDSQRRVFEQAFEDAGISPAERIVVVTDPGSPLEKLAHESGYRAIFHADPTVGGRYSALTAFGLVPAGLAGVDIERLLHEAESIVDELLEDDESNVGLKLGAAIAGTEPLRNKLIISSGAGAPVGFGDWVEQLVAESTGKQGTGLLPVVVNDEAPEITWNANDLLQIQVIADPENRDQNALFDAEEAMLVPQMPDDSVQIYGSLGALFLIWEFATAVAGRILGVNPFDQPDVESAKTAARAMLDVTPEPPSPQARMTHLDLFGPGHIVAPATGEPSDEISALADVLQALMDQLPENGYLSVQAYLDRLGHVDLMGIRPLLARQAQRPVTFGWGPRFLHSTGQYHKGGPAEGVFLQLTAETDIELGIPGRPFTFGQLIGAQAAGDARVLSEHGAVVVRIHLKDRSTAIDALVNAVRRLSER